MPKDIEAAAPPEEWVASRDDEHYNAGPYCSFDEALEHAPDDLDLVAGDRFFIGKRRPYRPTVDARAFIDQIGETTFDEVGDAADEFLCGVSDKDLEPFQKTLQIAFEAWLKYKGLEPKFWSVAEVRDCKYSGIDQGAYLLGD